MLRMHFTTEDLTKVRVGPTFGPLAETVFGLDALQRRSSGPPLRWRRSVLERLDPGVRLLGDLVPRAWVFDVISIVGRAASLEEGIEALQAAPLSVVETELRYTASSFGRLPGWAGGLVERHARVRRTVARALRDLHDVAVAPVWEQGATLLHAEQARLARVLAEGGVDALLSSLHPALRWRAPVLEIRSPAAPAGKDRWLDGQGLVVVPSLFCPAGYPTCKRLLAPEDPHVLFYPAVGDPVAACDLWTPGRSPRAALEALVGRTRSAVLTAIGDGPCTTTELAARACCSLASASEHATVLRRAGLVDTRRQGSSVLHALTPLGERLLEGVS
jgi:DNA-binding transcriptional ArsR family regulator